MSSSNKNWQDVLYAVWQSQVTSPAGGRSPAQYRDKEIADNIYRIYRLGSMTKKEKIFKIIFFTLPIITIISWLSFMIFGEFGKTASYLGVFCLVIFIIFMQIAPIWLKYISPLPPSHVIITAIETAFSKNKNEPDLQAINEKIKANIQNPPSLQSLLSSLSKSDWKERFVSELFLSQLGGSVVDEIFKLDKLTDEMDKSNLSIRIWLLKSIARETSLKFSKTYKKYFCNKCHVRFHPNKMKGQIKEFFGDKNATYTVYGCRKCKDSNNYINTEIDKITLLIDKNMKEETIIDGNNLKIKWSHDKELCDFDEVQIINADERDIEYFASSVANDKDEFRRGRYKNIKCYISRSNLAPETMNLLENSFDVQMQTIESSNFVSASNSTPEKANIFDEQSTEVKS